MGTCFSTDNTSYKRLKNSDINEQPLMDTPADNDGCMEFIYTLLYSYKRVEFLPDLVKILQENKNINT
jgi:hypothetical protein